MNDFKMLKARAKINISLDILGKRDDGYHEMQMIMQTVNLYDSVFMKKIKEPRIELKTNLSWLPTDESNLVYKAADLMRKTFDIEDGIFIDLTKEIPVAAGLAGGSSDCAATMLGIRNMFRISASNEELMEMSKNLGADVPYCIMRGTALAEGIGEKLTKLQNFPQCYVVLAKPPINVSTGPIFQAFDMAEVSARPDNKKLIGLLEKGDLKGIAQNMCNVLESVTIPKYPIIADIKTTMTESGALGALMSGSGPTVFGLFDDRDMAFNAMKTIKKKYSIKECYLTNIFNN